MVKKFLKVCSPLSQVSARNTNNALIDQMQIMAHLDKINNFNCVMAILAGLSNAAVHRLKFTMDELSESYKQEWNQFQEMMSSDNNYRLYRERLHKATPPVMPY